VWWFKYDQAAVQRAYNNALPAIRALYQDLGYDVSHSKLLVLVNHALTISPRWITFLTIGLPVYAVIELVEGIGLWQGRRWGEYFAMIATSLGLPLESYDLTRKLSALALVLLAVNLALVLYLIITKRLFGVRGGRRAYDARLRSESVLAEAQRFAAQRQTASRPASATAQGPGPATAVTTPPPAERAAAPATPAASADPR
jgi:uncharacterized membrane protein (DUF2068 family)